MWRVRETDIVPSTECDADSDTVRECEGEDEAPDHVSVTERLGTVWVPRDAVFALVRDLEKRDKLIVRISCESEGVGLLRDRVWEREKVGAVVTVKLDEMVEVFARGDWLSLADSVIDSDTVPVRAGSVRLTVVETVLVLVTLSDTDIESVSVKVGDSVGDMLPTVAVKVKDCVHVAVSV